MILLKGCAPTVILCGMAIEDFDQSSAKSIALRLMNRSGIKNGSEEIVDVAIIGAGCAGLYCAWRLAADQKKRTIHVFEKEGRVGGRLMSVDLFSHLIPDLPREEKRKAELGGMRFTDKQLLINSVIDRLQGQLDLGEHRGALSRRPYNFSTRLMYLRGQHLGTDRTKWPKKNQLKYDALHNGYTVGEIAGNVAKDAIRETLKFMLKDKAPQGAAWKKSIRDLLKRDGLKKTTLNAWRWRDWQEEATLKGDHVYDFGFQHLIDDVTALSMNLVRKSRLEKDTSEFLVDSLGYQSLMSQSNAAQSIPVFLADFDDPTYYTLAGGMDALPRMLAYKCRDEGVLIAERHAVKSIPMVKAGAETYFRLDVTCTPVNSVGQSNDQICYSRSVCAKTVIVALPQQAIQKLTFFGFPTEPHRNLQENLTRVDPHQAAKLFFRYDTPWWKDDFGLEKASAGESFLEARVITDKSIRQVYYYGAAEGKPAFIMGYCDDKFAQYWIDDAPKWEAQVSKLVALGMNSILAASPSVIKRGETILKEIHGHEILPGSKCGVLKQWKDAWHFWKPHIRPWEVAEKLVRPFAGINLFTCGEAYSLEQGWVEGALKSAERVLTQIGLEGWPDDINWEAYGCGSLQEYISN